MEKTREKTTDFPYNWSQFAISDGHYITGGQGVNAAIPELFESITYENGYTTFNPCFHVKRQYAYDVHLQGYDEVALNKRTNSFYHAPLNQLRGSLPTVPTKEQMKAFVQEAIQVMTPSMESGFELSNFLYELKEFESLFKLWDRGRSYWRNLASGGLNYSFGWLPFVGDVQRLYKGLRDFDEKLRRLKEGAGRLNLRHYSKFIESDLPLDLTWYDATSGVYQNEYKRHLDSASSRVKLTCTMKYTYQFPELDRLETQARAFLDTIGMQLSLYNLWEALPYSFVIDWFFNVGDVLKQFKHKWLPVNLYVKAIGVSAKWESRYDLYVKRCIGCANTRHTLLGRGFDKTFSRRKLEIDDSYFNLEFQTEGSLTNRRWILGALLLEQRVHR